MNGKKGIIKLKRRRKYAIPKGYNFIFHHIHNKNTALKRVIKKWIQKFRNNQKLAILQIFQYFISLSGCSGKINLGMVYLKNKMIINKMGKQFSKDCFEHPLIKKGPLGLRFSTKFIKFSNLFVREIFKLLDFDDAIDKIIHFLIDLSNSHYRPFRHTGTTAVLEMMSALINILMLSKNKTQFNKKKVEEIIPRLFKSVFLKRYRDTCAEIRSRSITELGIWMKKYPKLFLKDTYLRYIGWTLYDEVGQVRLKCIHALEPLYIEENKDALKLFTTKFKERIVNMAHDKINLVAWNAIKLANIIQKIYNHILDDEDAKIVLELLYCKNLKLSQAAGAFLSTKLFITNENSSIEKSKNEKYLLGLIQFIIDSNVDFSKHGQHLIGAIAKSSPTLIDWKCMTDLLLERTSSDEEILLKQSLLVKIVIYSIQSVLSSEPLERRTGKSSRISRRRSKIILETKSELTAHFIPILPVLIEKFSIHPEILLELISILQYFYLNIEFKSNFETSFDRLLDDFEKIIAFHSDEKLLLMCSKIFINLCNEDSVVYSKSREKLDTVINLSVDDYLKKFQKWKNSMDRHEQSESASELMGALRRIYILYEHRTSNYPDIWNHLIENLSMYQYKFFTLEVFQYNLKTCYSFLMWNMKELQENKLTPSFDTQTFKNQLDDFINICARFISGNFEIGVRTLTFNVICNLLINITKLSERVHTDDTSKLEFLLYKPSKEVVDILSGFIQEFVFDANSDDVSRKVELKDACSFLTTFLKLITHKVIPIKRGADIFKYYHKFSNEYGCILKPAISEIILLDPKEGGITILASLQILFGELHCSCAGRIQKNTPSLQEVKVLAQEFAAILSLSQINQDVVVILHYAGIKFATADDWGNIDISKKYENYSQLNLLFFVILLEFSFLLSEQNKKEVLNFVQKDSYKNCKPLALYIDSLRAD